ncbi:MAG: MAPEG family protein [Sphingosinicella sp.]
MTYSPILAPVVTLIAWSMLMMAWMMVTRMPAMKAKGLTLGNVPAGARGVGLDGVVDDQAQWKAHNYNHLMEQPTVFYAVALTLALLGSGGGYSLWLAWAYVGLRVLHSLIQATANIVRYRFFVFGAASLALVGLTIQAGRALLFPVA